MRTKRQFISLMLMLALLLGMIPGVAVSALAEEIEIEGDSQVELPTEVEFDLAAPALRTGAAPTATGTAEPFLSSEEGNEPVEKDVSKLNGSNWMAGIRGDAYLNDFNIPYTHDAAMKDYIYHWGTQSSGNFFGQGSYAKTQYLYIPEQLEAGVRILDLRLNNRYEAGYWGLTGKYYKQKDDYYNLYLCHGKNPSGGTFWAEDSDGEYVTIERVFKYVRDFLTKHPTETVILDVNIETQDNDKYGDEVADRTAYWLGQMFYQEDYEEKRWSDGSTTYVTYNSNYLINPSTGKPYIYIEPGNTSWRKPYTHMPQLKDCRGQVVVMYQAHQFEGRVGGMKRDIAGEVKILGGSNSASDSNKYEALVNDYVAGGPNDLMLPMPGEHRNLLRIVDTNSHANEFWDYVLVAIDDMHPLAIADYVHPKVFGEGKLLSIVGKYYGWVKMDGATERDCSYVWKTNFPTYTDYSTITVDPGDASDPTNAACYANYGTQTWSMPTGSYVTLPEDIYDVREHTQNKQEIPYLEYWMVTDSEGVLLGQYQPGESFKLEKDVTIKAVYHNTGKQWYIRLNWLDCDNVDGLRPDALNVVCTYRDTDGQQKEKTLKITSTTSVMDWLHHYYWATTFTGDLIDIRPVWGRIPTGDGAEQGIDSEEYYRYNIQADLEDNWSYTSSDKWTMSEGDWVSINLIHTTIANNTRSVSGNISWDDHDDADGVRPKSVTLHLYDEGTDTGRSMVVEPVTTVDDEEGVETTSWKWEFEDCTAYRDGRAIKYTVKEDYIPEYAAQQERIGSLNILNWHNTTQTVKRIEIEWDDEDNKEKIRPNSVYVNLLARKKGETEYETLAGKDIISDNLGYWYDTFTLWGKDFSDLEYDLTEEPVDGYTTTVEYYGEIYDVHGNAIKVDPETYDGDPDRVSWIYKVTNKLIGIPKPSVLEGVYKSGYVEGENNNIQGDIISFGQGTYIATGDTESPVRMTGAWEVRWSEYKDGKHHFTLGEQDVYISDTDDSRPWGIQVIGGSGTKEDPYTFKALHLEPVSYFEASWTGSRVKYTEKVCTEYTPVSEVTPADGQLVLSGTVENPGWYVVTGTGVNTFTNADLIIQGNVHLILVHGAHLYTDGDFNRHYDMKVEAGATLNIYQERRDGGGVIAANYKGITVGNDAEIILHDGVVNPQRAAYEEAPGFGSDGSGKLTVFGGYIQAEAGTAAIKDMKIYAYGGRITADTSKEGGLGISGGSITTYGDVKVYEGLQRGDNADANKILTEQDGDYPRTQDMTIRAGHNHEFFFAGEGDTITATCVGDEENCSLHGETVKLTLVAPAKKVYGDAGDPNATIDEAEPEIFSKTTGEEISIKYYKPENGTWSVLTEAPVAVGIYKAEVVLPGVVTDYTPSDGVYSAKYTTGTVRATVSYTIDKATVEITTPTASEITYGDSLADSTLTDGVAKVGDTEVTGEFTWANPSIKPTVSDSGTTKYTVIFTPTDTDNYETATCEVTLVVNPADPGATAPEALDLTYNGEERALVSKGSADHGIMLYALDTQPETDEGWQNSAPTATDAGDYTVWYKVFGDPNYSDTEPASVTAKIEKAASSGTVTGIEGLVYTGEAQDLVTPGEFVGEKLQYYVGDAEPTETTEWSDTATGTNAGTYKVWYRVVGDKNHNTYTAAEPVEVAIAKAVVKVSKPPVASAITYGQTLANSTLSGGDWLPKVDGHFVWADDTVEPAVADSAKTQYEVTFVPDDSTNYEAGADKSYATVVVIPANPTVTPPTANSPLVYTGAAQDLVTAGSATNGTMMYALGKTAPADKADWSESVPTGTEAGDYIVWYKVFGNTNYNDTGAAPLYVTIYPARSGAVTPDTLVYNGKEQKLVVPGTVVGGTLQYFVGDAAPTDASQWKDDIPTRTDAGDYKVWYRVKGDANHNDGEPGSVTATIARAPITPGVSITGWTYGEEANDPAVTGNPGNGEVTVTYSAEKEGAYTTAVPTQAGSWFVKAEVAETKNYQAGTAYPVSFAIAKVNVSIFADNKSGIYGDALQTLTWRLGGKTVNGDDLGISLSTTAKADSAPGDYPITVKWNGNKNYSATVVDGVYTVGKRPVTVAAGDQTVREGEQIATGVDHAMASGLAEGHKLSAVTLTAEGSAIKASGAKIADAAGADVTANYAVSYAAGKLNVQQPGTPAVFPPTAKELTYNGKAQALVTAGKAEGGTMQYSADNKTWSEKLPTGTDAGEYTVWYRVKGDADHGDVAASSLKATIAKAAPKVTAPTAEKLTYTGNAQALVSAGEVEGGKLLYSKDNKTWSEKIPTGTKAGRYTVYYKVEGDKNHSDAAAKRVKVTIAERKASPDYTLMARMTTSGSTRLKLSWSKVKGAQGYDVFFKNCDGKLNYTRVTITSKRSYTITGLKKRKAYKAYVVAWKKSGDRKYYIGDASPIVHAITGGYTSKQCNAKSVKLSKSSLTLKVGKSKTLKTTVKGVKSDREVLQHAKLVRYYSSDANVAKVNKNGKITAVGKGSCTVYAVANNGMRSKVTVKVN